MSYSNIGSIPQVSMDFLVDVHLVTDDFFMGGETVNFNERSPEERITLGIGAAIYSIPYAIGRVFYDGMKNVTQYIEQRVTGEPVSALLKDRKPMAYGVFGLPLSAPLIGAMGIMETAVRAAGISPYGGHVVRAAAKRATHISQRYTSWLIEPSSDASIQKDQDMVFSCPKNGWQVADRIGLITLPGLVAATEIIGATLFTAAFGVGECIIRTLYFLGKHAARALICLGSYVGRALLYIGKHIGHALYYLGSHLARGLLYLGRHVGHALLYVGRHIGRALLYVGRHIGRALLYLGSHLARVLLYLGDHLRRVFGFSQFGLEVVALAVKRMRNMSPYTRALFSVDSKEALNAAIEREQDAFFEKLRNGWGSRDIADRVSLVTFPGLFAAFAMGVGVGVTAIGFVGKMIGQALFYLSKYVSRVFLYLGDHLRRVFGFSQFGLEVVALAVKRMRNMSPYTRAFFSVDSKEALNAAIEREQDAFFEKLRNGWGSREIADRMSLVTFPGLFAALAMGVGVGVTAIGFVGVYTFRALHYLGSHVARALLYLGDHVRRVFGISQFGLDVVALAVKRMRNMSSYTRALFCVESKTVLNAVIEREQDDLFKLRNGWGSREIADRMSLVTFPGLFAALAMGVGVSVTAIGFVGKYIFRALSFVCGMIGRILSFAGNVIGHMLRFTGKVIRNLLGFTPYGASVIKAAWMRAANMGPTWFFKYRDDSIGRDHDIVATLPTNAWEILEMGALFTLPGALALASFGLVMGLNVLDSARRVLGLSNRGINGMAFVFSECAKMMGFNISKEKKIDASIASWWDGMDGIGMVISGMAAGVIGTVLMAPLAFIGLSKSNYHRFNYYRHYINNDINRRRENGDAQNPLVITHENELLECEKNSSLGRFFSKVNALNIFSGILYYTTRYIVAPTLYALFRGIRHLFGVIPMIKLIHKVIHPPQEDSSPEGQFRKRFAELKEALNEYGELKMPVEKRNLIGRVRFNLFSEARKIISLGYTPEERVLMIFEDRFEELLRVMKREKRRGNATINVSQFFSVVGVKNGNRYDYDNMIKPVLRPFSLEDKEKVKERTNFIKSYIMRK